MEDFESKLADALEAGIIASGMTVNQARRFTIAFSKALGIKPPTTEEIEDYERSSMAAN